MKKIIKLTVFAIAALLLTCIGLAALGGTLKNSETAAAPTAATQAAPTAAPASDNSDVAAYLRTMAKHTTTISGALTDISKLSARPQLTDPSWKVDMALAFAILRNENIAMQQITPPAAMQAVHAEVLLATADLDAMTYRYAAGIDAMDASEIRAAANLLKSGSQHIVTATELMQAAK